MSWLFKQLTLKDLIGWLLGLCALWYTTQMRQQAKDAEQDKAQALTELQLSNLIPLLQENNKEIKNTTDKLDDVRIQLERKADRKP